MIKTLGKGAYGVVSLVQSLKTRKMFALKVIDRKVLRKKRLGASDEVGTGVPVLWRVLAATLTHARCGHATMPWPHRNSNAKLPS